MNVKKHSKTKTIGILFTALFIVLIFLSSTIYSLNMPVVTAVLPTKDKLNKIEITTGVVSYALSKDIYTDLGGNIDRVPVSEGDSVKKGDPLVYMDFSASISDKKEELAKSEAESASKLKELDIGISRLNVEIEKIQINITNVRRMIDELKNKIYEVPKAAEYELNQCEADIKTALDNYNRLKILYEAKTVPLNDLTAAETTLSSLYDKLEYLTEKKASDLMEKEKEREDQIKANEYQLEVFYKDIETKKLELDNANNQKQKLHADLIFEKDEINKGIKDYEDGAVILAEYDSVIIDVSVNEGQHIGANQKLLSYGMESDYIIECAVTVDNNFIAVGDECYLSNTTHTLTGVVSGLKPSGLDRPNSKTVTVKAPDVILGESFDIRFEKKSDASFTLIPKGALNMDNDGYFINQVKRRDGIMGKEYYTEKVRVYIGDTDSDYVAVLKGIGFFEPLALLSDKPFEEGETIRLKNESDFFEN